MALEQLRKFLKSLPSGEMTESAALLTLKKLLSESWDSIEGSHAESMAAHKLNRIENVVWSPPVISFEIERHGATVMGSTYANVHNWSVDVDHAVAHCNPFGRKLQVRERAPRLDVKPIAEEIAQKIISTQNDARLRWSKDRTKVRVIIGQVIASASTFTQTLTGRRRRFRQSLEEHLKRAGWSRAPGFYTFRREQYR